MGGPLHTFQLFPPYSDRSGQSYQRVAVWHQGKGKQAIRGRKREPISAPAVHGDHLQLFDYSVQVRQQGRAKKRVSFSVIVKCRGGFVAGPSGCRWYKVLWRNGGSAGSTGLCACKFIYTKSLISIDGKTRMNGVIEDKFFFKQK